MEVMIWFVFLMGALVVLSSVRVLNEWEKGVVLRLGRMQGTRGPGLTLVIPIIETLYRVDMRTVTMDVPPQDVITKDNITLKVNAVVYFQVTNAQGAISKVADYYFATSQLAQTILRSVLGQFHLDEILDQRDTINQRLQELLDSQTGPWGIKVTLVELKNIDLPKEMQVAMARQAEAERERRAKIISADGELGRAEKLAEASKKLSESPSAMQLAFLQTLSEIGDSSGTKTIVLPIPIDLIQAFVAKK